MVSIALIVVGLIASATTNVEGSADSLRPTPINNDFGSTVRRSKSCPMIPATLYKGLRTPPPPECNEKCQASKFQKLIEDIVKTLFIKDAQSSAQEIRKIAKSYLSSTAPDEHYFEAVLHYIGAQSYALAYYASLVDHSNPNVQFMQSFALYIVSACFFQQK
ncbi:unnamed protein product [Albugo candida]|uniref:Uncharacterized protein n=1 Tax=Albugo candida TaxID=65357 RepID=A0A024FU93_9STRA|nr:unnamed protein product [Albugo candida]|eukprot:CCI10596.1 unnamed protein product [Albugo candida]